MKWMDEEWYCNVYHFLEMLTIQKAMVVECERVKKKASHFIIKGKGLYFRDSDGMMKLCLGKDSIKEVLFKFHEGAVGGHFG